MGAVPRDGRRLGCELPLHEGRARGRLVRAGRVVAHAARRARARRRSCSSRGRACPRVDGTPGPVLPRERVVWLHFLVVVAHDLRHPLPVLRVGRAVRLVEPRVDLQRDDADHDGAHGHARVPRRAARAQPVGRRRRRHRRACSSSSGRGSTRRSPAASPASSRASWRPLCYGFTFGYQRRFLSQRPIAPATFAFLSIGVSAVVMLALTPWIALTPGRPRLDDRRLAARARRARHRPRLHLEHQRAARVGSDRHVDGHLRDARRRRRARGAAARRALLVARAGRCRARAARHPARAGPAAPAAPPRRRRRLRQRELRRPAPRRPARHAARSYRCARRFRARFATDIASPRGATCTRSRRRNAAARRATALDKSATPSMVG